MRQLEEFAITLLITVHALDSSLRTSLYTVDGVIFVFQYICMKRELAATATQLSNCRLDNKRMYKEKEDKEEAIHKLNEMVIN